jgi:hypothetical protein
MVKQFLWPGTGFQTDFLCENQLDFGETYKMAKNAGLCFCQMEGVC